jgi:putative sterol carrier protein
MSVSDIESVLDTKLASFSELNAKLKFDFGDDRLFIDGTQNPATISHDDDEADCTVVASTDTMQKIVDGQMDPTVAFMSGKLKVKGNTGLAMKLGAILK